MKGLFLFLFLFSAALTGCQTTVAVEVDDSDIIKPATPVGLPIALLSKAKDVRDGQGIDQVGRHTISLLMIPGPTVTTERQHLDDAIASGVKQVLTKAGYEVTTVERISDGKGPVLVAQIDDLRNYLFSWMYPLGIVWGKMELSLHLMSPDGKELWTANADGSGGIMASLLYMSGFETRVQGDLKDNLNQIGVIVTSDQFKGVLTKAQAGR